MTGFAGILLSADVLETGWFQALAAFVWVNTMVYAALSLAHLLPRRRRREARQYRAARAASAAPTSRADPASGSPGTVDES